MRAIIRLTIQTQAGLFFAHYSESGLIELAFPNQRTRPATKGKILPTVHTWHTTTARAVKAVLAGRPVRELPPLDFWSGTSFQKAVWEELLWIPAGETRSYAEIARAIRKPKAARAVGGACGANPIPLLIPCHRVLAANRKIGGFSGGLKWKRRLLKMEGVTTQS